MREDGLLAHDYCEEPGMSVVTGYAGLLPYVDLACVLGVLGSVDRQVHVCGTQGWLDRQHVSPMLLLNGAGGECVDDMRMLESDEGLCRVFRSAERYGLNRSDRRVLDKRLRKGRQRTFPSETRQRDYLEAFHNVAEEARRVAGRAFIPAKNEALLALDEANHDLVCSVCRHSVRGEVREATIDIDATVQETSKRSALLCYRGFTAYQPLTALWAETGLAVHSEFRDGNVPAGHEMLRFLMETLAVLLSSVEKFRVRMDSASYQHDVLRYMATGDGGKRDVIEFTVSADMVPEFREVVRAAPEAEWRPLTKEGRGERLPANLEWTEVVYVPNATATGQHEPCRYLAIREPLDQGVLDMQGADGQLVLPFATVVRAGNAFRLSGIVTNRGGDGGELIDWHHGRCGKGEEIHSIMKSDFAGGRFPSDKFGANAAWWAIVVLATNLQAAVRLLVLPNPLKPKLTKALRFGLIQVPTRLMERSRQLVIRLARGHPALNVLLAMRAEMARMVPMPCA